MMFFSEPVSIICRSVLFLVLHDRIHPEPLPGGRLSLELVAQGADEEAVAVRDLLDHLGGGLAAAVSGLRLNADQQRVGLKKGTR